MQIHYQDDWLIAVEKPSGMLAVIGRGPQNALNLATDVQTAWPGALPVHRLDQGTSGVMLFARTAEMHRQMNALFAARRVEKRYVAVVAGRPAASAGCIELPLMKDWPNRPRQKVDRALGKPSTTYWWVWGMEVENGAALEELPKVREEFHAVGHEACANPQGEEVTTRLELRPVTGRTHQLRVHLAEIGHPIIGDELYAPAKIAVASARLLLHAAELAFVHPANGKEVRIRSAVPF
ncbi:MAG: RluA family pseudouridine synthase [Pirellulales bacterium]|nr:RluA family pseudouridine synthase [Pirellulales bacterium]